LWARARSLASGRLGSAGVLGALLLVMVVSSFVSPRFMTTANLLNVMQQIAIVGVLALGMTFVIITAGIDLSVGATLALASVVSASIVTQHGMRVGILVTLALGAVIGLVNGLGVVWGGIPPFVMTLAMMAVVTGSAFIYS